MSGRLAASCVLLALAACSGVVDLPAAVVVVELSPSDTWSIDGLRWEPTEAVVRAERLDAARVALRVPESALGRPLRLRHDAACPSEVVPDRSGAAVTLSPLLDPGPPRPQLGYDTPFRVELGVGCDEARTGEIAWRQTEGAPVRDLAPADSGLAITGRTAPPPQGPRPWGLLPVSPATRGAAVLEATLSRPGRADLVVRVSIAAAARQGGIPSVEIGHRLLLSGQGWELRQRPPQGASRLEPAGALTALVPDHPGQYRLADGAGRELLLRAGRHDETPLDCGRPECHPVETRRAASSPMTTVLSRGVEGALGASHSLRCAARCHAPGEPGLDDGGFFHVAEEHGVPIGDRVVGGWAALPRGVRRVGGVGCTACHGPGAIPEPSARWAILRADVCAVCHDAPPRYPAVAEWRASAMARSDADAARRAEGCADCHTTAGFLARTGARPAREHGRVPDEVGGIGISCAACHAAHAGRVGPAQLRLLAPPASLGDAATDLADGPSSVCLSCHAPLDAAPAATAAALLLAVGPEGAVADAPTPHAEVRDGCVGCHMPDEGGHEFGVDHAACAECHAGQAPPPDATIRERALARWRELGGDPAAPPHASLSAEDDTEAGRARHAVRMVLEDPAAAVHNAAFARALLESAGAD